VPVRGVLTNAVWYTYLQWGSPFPFRRLCSDASRNEEIMVISDDDEIPSPQQSKQPRKQ
jgi:hypothetical protein